MKETIENVKKLYQYGKEYRKNLVWLVIDFISGVIVGIIIPLLAARQILYFTSSSCKQTIIASLLILLVQAYSAFGAFFFWRKNSQRFIKGTTKNLQIVIRKRDFENKSGRYG